MNKKNLQELTKLGLSKRTISLMTESEAKLLFEKINRKKETKEAEQTTKKITKLQPTDQLPPKTTVQQARAMVTKPELTKTVDTANFDPSKSKGPSDLADENELTEVKKKKKKYNPFAVCASSVGTDNKKKFKDCLMGVKNKLQEGQNPYEYIIESKMQEIIEDNLAPKISKKELLKIIQEKKMMMKRPIGMNVETMEGETKTKEREKVTTKPTTKPTNPSKNPNPNVKPSPKAMMMKKETMENETAPSPERTITTPKTEPAQRPSHPGRKNKEQPNPEPKAEQKKEEFINAITKLIGKGK